MSKLARSNFVKFYLQLKETFRWEPSQAYFIGATFFQMKNIEPEINKIKQCMHLIKVYTPFFSEFRSKNSLPVACMLSCEEEPKEILQHMIAVSDELRRYFRLNQLLPYISYILLNDISVISYQDTICKARQLQVWFRDYNQGMISKEVIPIFILLAMNEDMKDILTSYQTYQNYFGDVISNQKTLEILSLFLSAESEEHYKRCEWIMKTAQLLYKKGIFTSTWIEWIALSLLGKEDISTDYAIDLIQQNYDFLSDYTSIGALDTGRLTKCFYSILLSLHRETTDAFFSGTKLYLAATLLLKQNRLLEDME